MNERTESQNNSILFRFSLSNSKNEIPSHWNAIQLKWSKLMCSDSFFLFFFESHHKTSLCFKVYRCNRRIQFEKSMNAFFTIHWHWTTNNGHRVMLTTIRFYLKWNVYGAQINTQLNQPQMLFWLSSRLNQKLRIILYKMK